MSSDSSDIDARIDEWQWAMEHEPPMRRPGEDLDWYDDRDVEHSAEHATVDQIVCINPDEPGEWICVNPDGTVPDVDLLDPADDLPDSQMEVDR